MHGAGTLRSAAIQTPSDWFRLVLGLSIVFALFHLSATILGSDRGQYGILVGAIVVTATAAADRFLLRRQTGGAIHLGLGWPDRRGIAAAAAIAFLLLIAALLFARARGQMPTLYAGWISLIPGLIAQAGIAEEVLFRGYLFGHVRTERTFWRAAAASMVPFVAVHLVLFFSMPWPIALASTILAVIISFPLAYLFELGGATIWAPAILHFVVQATVKILVFREGAELFAFAWMAASATIPWLVFTVQTATTRRGAR
jgi:membrane protease YdiL (CAAX protease family)